MIFSTKENEADIPYSIVCKLSKEYPLSAKQVYKKIIESDTSISYQYIHKILNQLAERKVLLVEERKYSLNPDWIKKIKKFVNLIDENYEYDYKIFSRKVNSEILNLLSVKEKKCLFENIDALIRNKATNKLNEWYYKFYDPEDKEFNYIKSIVNLKNKSILEVGCGTGRITSKLVKHSKKIMAINNNYECIQHCKGKLEGVRFFHQDTRDLLKTIKSGEKFDIIISGWTGLHYLEKDELKRVLGYYHQLLKENGHLIILEAYYNTDYVKILDLLTGIKKNIKKKVRFLKELIIETFGNVSENVIMTSYNFPSYEELEQYFMIEMQFEHRKKWNKRMSTKLKKFISERDNNVEISEAPIIFHSKK